jgi:FKBP-type peptidyl-prolyl cis-trans isomerase 2
MKNAILYAALILFSMLVSSCSATEETKEPVVGPGKTITFDFAAGFDNGSLFDTTFEVAAREAEIYDPNINYAPAKIVYGRDLIVLGLEEAMLGMKEGEIKNIRVPPTKAYGEKLSDSTTSLSKTSVSNYETLKVNDLITLIDQQNNQINAYVKKIGQENITVDLNHPLAGEYVQFSVIVISIE